jgi:hypothetical protein
MFRKFASFLSFRSTLLIMFSVQLTAGNAQTISLSDLSSFRSAPLNWKMAGDVIADLNATQVLKLKDGAGMLVNLPIEDSARADLLSMAEFGDADIELDYLMSKGSNSGVYLQGRYEIQLRDSWGVLHPRPSDNGGIYERWDESRPEGQKGYEGYAPRQNVSKAPGLWQHLKISFQAPRFSNGMKSENAKMIRVELNGVLIHENVELFGPTRGGGEGESAKGPLRLQGDHGTVAFRNINITPYDKARPTVQNLQYALYKGPVNREPDYAKAKPVLSGNLDMLTASIDNLPDTFALRYKGTIKVAEAGAYNFNVITAGGPALLQINNQKLSLLGRRGVASANLPAGDLPFELVYLKKSDWVKPAIMLMISGPGIREYMISDASNFVSEQTDPILVDAPVNTVLRSFMDIPGKRVVHAVSVGSPDEIHYTYDMDFSSIVQVWRGGFLDATPMWNERGDGSSRPRGSKEVFGTPVFSISKLGSPTDPWKKDTAGSSFRAKGYELDDQDRPIFHYYIFGVLINDATQVLENRQGIRREITLAAPSKDLYVRLAGGATIEDLGNNLYLLNDKAYYLQVDNSDEKPFIRDAGDHKELLVPIKSKLKYTVLF